MELKLLNKNCLNCNLEFESLDGRKKYCCEWCVQLAKNERRRHSSFGELDAKAWKRLAAANHQHLIHKYANHYTGNTSLAYS